MFALTPRTWRTRELLPRTETPFGWVPEEVSSLFNRFLTSLPIPETFEWPYRWALTMEEKEKEFVVRVELPGFEPEEVKVEVLGERLTIEAEHKVPAEEKAEEKAEREYVHVKREVTLPPTVETEKLEAVYRKGVLEVHLPRKPEAMARRIEVKT
jgi:HSP20 family molecular chaperone IbpA